jgi:hypothetical protein
MSDAAISSIIVMVMFMGTSHPVVHADNEQE